MARPRNKPVTDPRSKQEVPGLYFKKSNRSFYSIPQAGKEQYWGRSKLQAIDDFRHATVPRVIERIPDDWAYSDLLEAGVPEEVIDGSPELIAMAKKGQFTVRREWVDQHFQKHPLAHFVKNQERSRQGLPDLEPLESEDGAPTSRKRLADTLKFWAEWKKEEGREPQTINDMSARFKCFIRCVGNKLVSELSHDDFIKWQRYVMRESKKRAKPELWSNRRHQAVKYILKFTKRKESKWGFPDGLFEWSDCYDRKKYVAGRENKQPIPADAFHKLLAAANQQAQTDPEQYDRNSQRGRAQRLQARRKKREGIQNLAMLKLVLACDLDNSDCARIKWMNIRDFDGDDPYLDFPRQKVKWLVGAGVDRVTPLLPSVIKALKKWREYEPQPDSGLVFKTAQKSPFTSRTVSNVYKRLREAAELDARWTFKHIRNVGSSLAKRAKPPVDERQAFLGHAINGTSKFYEGNVDQTYLITLVNLIGAEYLEGNSIRS